MTTPCLVPVYKDKFGFKSRRNLATIVRSPVISSTFQALHHTDIIIIRNFSEGGVKTKANV